MKLKKMLSSIIATAMLLSSMGLTAFAQESIAVATKTELDTAIGSAKEGDTILLTADLEYSGSRINIDKQITLDLNGKTITTNGSYGVIKADGGCSIINGKIVYTGKNAVIKVWEAEKIENVEIEATDTSGATIGGIVIQENATGIDTIKNVTIKGEGLTNGIETYLCGNAQVIGSMENVTIDAVGTGMLISAPCGTATNCTIKGGVSGIDMQLKGTYNVSLNLVNCKVEGGEQAVYARDEQNGYTYVGSLTLIADENTTFENENGVLLTQATEETTNVTLPEAITSVTYVAKVGETKYTNIQEAIVAAQEGNTIVLIDNVTEDVTISKNIILDGANFNYVGKMILNAANVTIQNLNVIGGNIIKGNGTVAGANISIKNCDFDGQMGNVYAVELRGTGKIVIENCTAKDYGYGFLHVPKSNNTVTVKNVRISGVNYGLKIDYSNGVNLENVTIEANKYGIYDSNYGEKVYTIKDCDITGANPIKIWERNTTKYDTFVFEGKNNLGKTEFTISQYAILKLADADAVLKACEGLNVTTDVEDCCVKYTDETYGVVLTTEITWDYEQDAGFYVLEDKTYGMIRFLFAADVNGEIEEYGIKYNNGLNITEEVTTDGKTSKASGNESSFYGDLYEIEENSDTTYYAAAFIKVDGEYLWSEVASCSPNWGNNFTGYTGGTN